MRRGSCSNRAGRTTRPGPRTSSPPASAGESRFGRGKAVL
jgi:hypothetical protein